MAKSAKRANRSEAIVFINKLEAARRQLDAAIRMTFANEDELAIHTVAGAAYRVLRDMLERRGQNDHEYLMRHGLLAYARSLLKGEISSRELKDMQLFAIVSWIAGHIRDRVDDVTVNDINFELDGHARASQWQSMAKVANFLKHADRDKNSSLSLKDVDNDKLLMYACAAYRMVRRAFTPEMECFITYWAIAPERRQYLDAHRREFADSLSRLNPSRRRAACRRFIRLSRKEIASLRSQ